MAGLKKISKEKINQIVEAVRAGNFIETAAAFAGLSKQTLYNWLKEGARERDRRESGEKPDRTKDLYVQLSLQIEQAMAEAEMRDVEIITRAAEQQWQAAAWRLERKYPDRWGRKVAVDAKQEITLPQVQFIFTKEEQDG